MSAAALLVAVFLACAVEAVEAATIVLAAGTARNWRSAMMGLPILPACQDRRERQTAICG